MKNKKKKGFLISNVFDDEKSAKIVLPLHQRLKTDVELKT